MEIQQIFEVIWNALRWVGQNLVFINVLFSIVIIFLERRDPKSVWAWLLLLYFIPVAGFIFYLILGQDFRKNRMFRIKEVEDAISYEIRHQERDIVEKRYSPLQKEQKDYEDLVLFNLESSSAIYSDDNQVELYTDGMLKFQALADELKKAKKFIHLQYYIIKNDEALKMILPIMKEKAKQGVEVRILYDAMGCRCMRRKDWKEIRAAGIQTAEFFPAVFKKVQLRINYRNHRKLVIIDGKIGFVGGFNIGREYLGKDNYFQYWRDTHLKVSGSAVSALNLRFMLDWNFAAKENLPLMDYYLEPKEEHNRKDFPFQNVGMQIISSGPDSMNQNIRNNYIRIIQKAKHHIYVQTPYFIPDEALLLALQMAAMSGVDVRVMIPCKPDHMFVYWATYSYMNELLDAGVKCYLYTPGFLHAKGISVDGRVSCFGTANMDIRSFKLNFEVNAMIYDSGVSRELDARFEKDLEDCTQITQLEYGKRSRIIRFKEQVCRLLSPIL